MLESKLQRNIRGRLERAFPGSVWVKYHGGPFTRAGMPDLIGCVAGRMCALEVKRPGEEASRIQHATIARLKRAGAIVGVVTTCAEALDIVRMELDPIGPCFELAGGRNDQGYVRIKFGGKLWRGHRLMWYLMRGPIPDGMDVLHKCDNPPCGRFDHLYLGTDLENAGDRTARGRGTSKVTAEEVVIIRSLRAAGGMTLEGIGRRFDLSKAQVSSICKRRTWKHIP